MGCYLRTYKGMKMEVVVGAEEVEPVFGAPEPDE
jgi:hypothetical protein